MTNKELNTRVSLKYDTYDNWQTNNPILLAGELAIALIPASTGAVAQEPAVLLKVGDGTTAYKGLPFVSGGAADVYPWAKAATKPAYTADEIDGLKDYISGEVKDSNTTYKIEQDAQDPHKLVLYEKEIGSSTWNPVSTIMTADTIYDDTELNDEIDALKIKVTTLIGNDTAKSVRTIANEELAAQLIPEGAAESLNTLQEIAAWIQEHPDDASAMNSAITALQAQLTGINSGNGTVKAYVDAAISALNIGDYITASALAAAIGNLDVDDAAVEGQVVSAVSEIDGKIQVSRRALVATDIPTLAIDKISGLQTALDGKVNSDALADVATSGKIEDLTQDTYIVLNCGSSSVNV